MEDINFLDLNCTNILHVSRKRDSNAGYMEFCLRAYTMAIYDANGMRYSTPATEEERLEAIEWLKSKEADNMLSCLAEYYGFNYDSCIETIQEMLNCL